MTDRRILNKLEFLDLYQAAHRFRELKNQLAATRRENTKLRNRLLKLTVVKEEKYNPPRTDRSPGRYTPGGSTKAHVL